MSHDLWREDSNSLDLTEGLEDRVYVPFVYTRDHAEWLTADGQASFARGTEARVNQSQEEAYAAMAMKDTLSSPFGLDSACPTLSLSDVRAQPPKKDEGYLTLKTEGDLPDTTAIIRTLMSHRDLIMNNQMIYLIVDNRMPADVPRWPAFAAWWASRRCLVGPQEETTDILWVCADATTGLHKVPYYWAAGVFVLEVARSCIRRNTLHSLTMTVYQSRFLKCKIYCSWRISSTSGSICWGVHAQSLASVQELVCSSSQRLTWNIMQAWSFQSAIEASTVR